MKVWRYGCAIERLGGRYRLDGSLGSGGMADVYLAWDEREEREVAIKIVKTDDLDQETLNRFLKEASQVVGWNHPHILRVYENVKLELLDAAHGSIVPYIVMEYVRGGDLHKRLKSGQPYPMAETLSIFAQLCSAVEYAHERNVIHRDLKPLNILFHRLPDGSEQAVLSDFGLAVQVDATHHTFARGGTLAYMAPEQFRGQSIPASDIFALGVILYQLCTGKLPFRRSLQDLQHGGLFETPERPSAVNPALPKLLDDAILTAIAKDPAKRFATASLFWKHVRLAMMPPPIQASTTPLKADKEDARHLADSLPPATSNAQDGPQVLANLAVEQVSLFKVVDNPDPRLVGFSPPHSENIDQLPASAIMPASASQLSVPLPPLRQPNTVPAPTMPPNISLIPSPRPDTPTVPVIHSAIAPAPLNPATKQINNGGMAPAGTTGEVPGAAVPTHGGTPPTPRNTAPAGSLHGLRSKIGHRWLVAIALILLVLLLVFGSISLIAPNLLGLLTGAAPGGSSSNTITIRPDSKDLKSTYTISAVIGTPDPSQRQVQARLLSFITPSQSKMVKTTGSGSIPATQATGILTFYNSTTSMQSVAAGTVFVGTDGAEVINDERADIPAASPPVEGSVTVTAHAIEAGASGNIPALDINAACCLSGVTVQNITTFSGGQNAQNYTYVLQSDIDSTASDLETTLTQNGQAAVQKQLHTGEQLAGPPQCLSNVSSDHAAGDRVTNVMVTVRVNCTGEVYDHQGVVTMAAGLLKEEAVSTPGAGYSLVGKVVTAVTQATVGKNETVSLLVYAEGRWVYQFTNTQKQNLANLIKGKSQNDAQTLLLKQPGVSKVSIDISGGGDTLPTDATQIKIVAQTVPGIPVTVTPVGGSDTPTTPRSTATSGTAMTPTATPTAING